MSADLYSSIIGAHHGRPHKIPNGRNLRNEKQIDVWEQERLDVVDRLVARLGDIPRKAIKKDDPAYGGWLV